MTPMFVAWLFTNTDPDVLDALYLADFKRWCLENDPDGVYNRLRTKIKTGGRSRKRKHSRKKRTRCRSLQKK